MSGSFDPVGEQVTWIADTGLFVACGRRQNDKYVALQRFALRNDVSFVIPRRVYDELCGAPDRSTPGRTPIDGAVDAGWVTVAAEPDYTNGPVARVMDDTRSFIASASNRHEDRIEQADAALAAVAAERLDDGEARFVCIVTTDVDAGEAAVSALARNGFEDRVRFEDGFQLIEETS